LGIAQRTMQNVARFIRKNVESTQNAHKNTVKY